MNLHGIVRGAINTVNPDITGVWRESTGFTQDASGKAIPGYTDHAGIRMQVQALSGKDLMHPNFVSLQGVKRSVYMFSNVQGVNRPDAKGGDLLLFPENRGGEARTWLVVQVLETWTPDAAGWCKVGVVLQPDVAEA
jgi:hypothetical protein